MDKEEQYVGMNMTEFRRMIIIGLTVLLVGTGLYSVYQYVFIESKANEAIIEVCQDEVTKDVTEENDTNREMVKKADQAVEIEELGLKVNAISFDETNVKIDDDEEVKEPKTDVETETETETEDYIIDDISFTGYATCTLNVRSGPSTEFDVCGTISKGSKVEVIGKVDNWYLMTYKDQDTFVCADYVSEEVVHEETKENKKTYGSVTEGDVIKGEATYYCSCCKCCGKSDGITASGVKAYDGSVACNWLPLGTKILINGTEYTVCDRGGTDFNNIGRIDIFTSQGHQKALALGRKNITITIKSLP